MKKLTLIIILVSFFYPLISQVSGEEKLSGYEKNASQNEVTATMTSASRLFKNPEDLTSVIVVIPKGSKVIVLGSDSTYLNVYYEDNEGFIYRKHAAIDRNQLNETVPEEEKAVTEQQADNPVKQQVSRFTYLENKYGTSMAARIYSGKIWKGMNADMVRDSWGRADKINREISGNTIKEEWIYKTTWLYLENNTLVEWGPIRN
jgi:hypothetical protein